jgi:hypothetical protein
MAGPWGTGPGVVGLPAAGVCAQSSLSSCSWETSWVPIGHTNQEDGWRLRMTEERHAAHTSGGLTSPLPRSGFVQLLNIWKCFHITLPITPCEMSV